MSYADLRHPAEEDKVFAAYGRAMHGSQALEHWLRILVNVHRITSKELTTQAEVERAIETLSTSTMGTVFAALRALGRYPLLEDQLSRAVSERNRLAHHYFGEWSEIWNGIETDVRMIDDADRIRLLFEETVSQLAKTIREHLDIIGADPDSYIPGLRQRINDHSAPGGAMSE